MAATTDEVEVSPWINLATAQRFLGVGRTGLLALISSGELTVRRLPHCHARVRADEVLQLARRSTRASVATNSPEMAGAGGRA
jgi:hypothetical protein